MNGPEEAARLEEIQAAIDRLLPDQRAQLIQRLAPGAPEPPKLPAISVSRKLANPAGIIAAIALLIAGVEITGVFHKTSEWRTGPLDQARTYVQQKDFKRAEDIYRSILKTDPGNVETKRLLASVVYRQGRTEEAARIVQSMHPDPNPKAPTPPK